MLHGFNGSTFSYRDTLPGVGRALADAGVPCRLIAMDRPPFGLSERPPVPPSGAPDANPYAAPAAGARFAAGLLRRLGVRHAVVVGHSAGAGVAVELALSRPELVSGLCLVAPALPVSDRGPLEGQGLRQLLRLAATRALLGADGPGLHYVRRQVERRKEDLLQGGAAGMYANAGGVDLAAAAEGYLKPLRAHGWDRGVLEMYRALSAAGGLLGGRAPGDYAALSGPILVLQGSLDGAVPPEVARDLVALLRRQRRGSPAARPTAAQGADEDPGAAGAATSEGEGGVRYEEMAGVGHIPMEERPRDFNARLAAWLLALQRRGAAAGGAPQGAAAAE
ncbi:MAG: Alpha/Beta hydrolase protein [Monoraphidium minutum]|nr:MAG: Alpha/Beta hydrolase protein [Monoraphidium minutum]